MKQNMVFRRERKREKVVVGPGSKGCIAGYETISRRELRVRRRGLVGSADGRWGINVSVGVCCKQNTAFIRERKEEKVAV